MIAEEIEQGAKGRTPAFLLAAKPMAAMLLVAHEPGHPDRREQGGAEDHEAKEVNITNARPETAPQ